MKKITFNNHFPSKLITKFKYWPWAILLFQFIWLIVTFYNDGITLIDSDMASEMILADLLNEEGGFILSQNWLYSTELRVIGNQPVYRLSLLLFNNWHIARTFSMGLLIAILLGSYFFMAKNAGLKDLGVWGAVLMISPLSYVYSWLFVIGNFLIMNIAIGFICLGLLFILHRSKHQFKKIVSFAIVVCLAFISGLGGIRMTVIFFLPLVATFTLFALIDLSKTNQQDLNWSVLKAPKYLLSGTTILAFISNIIGYYINSNVLANMYKFQSYNTIKLRDINLATIFSRFGQIAQLFGYQHNMPLFSTQGRHSLFAILCFAITIVSFILMAKLWKRLSQLKQMLFAFASILLLSNIFINYLSQQELVNYLIPAFIYCLIVIDMAISEIPYKNKITKALAYMLILIAVTSFYIEPYIQYSYSKDSNKKYEAVQWLMDNGYENGYATFWNSNILTEYSNGEINMHTIYGNVADYSLDDFKYHRFLQKKSQIDNPPKGKVFVLISEKEYNQNPAFAINESLAYSNDGYYVFTYDSADDLFVASK